MSIDPPLPDRHALAALGAIWADRDQLETFRAAIEAAHHLGRDADDIPS